MTNIPNPIVSDTLVVVVSEERFERLDVCDLCFISHTHGTRARIEEAVTMLHSGILKPKKVLRRSN